MRFFHRKKNRLSSEKEIGSLFADGVANFIYPIKVLYLTFNSSDADYKVLVTVSKRNFKKAVDRNRVKRRIKEAFRKNSFHIVKALEGKELGINIAFVYVSNNILEYKEIETLVVKQISYLANRLDKIE